MERDDLQKRIDILTALLTIKRHEIGVYACELDGRQVRVLGRVVFKGETFDAAPLAILPTEEELERLVPIEEE